MGTPCIVLDEEGTLWRERAGAVSQATLQGMYKSIPSHHQWTSGFSSTLHTPLTSYHVKHKYTLVTVSIVAIHQGCFSL